MKEGHHRMTPIDQWKTICEVEAAGPDNETQGTQAPTTNTNTTNGKIPFQNPQEVYPIQLVLQFQVAIDIHNHPTRDQVRRHPSRII